MSDNSYREIENLIYRFCELIDAGDYEGLGDMFADALHTSGSGVPVTGHDEVVDYYTKRTRRFPETGTPRTKHLTTNLIIELDEANDRASCRSYFTVFQAVPGVMALQPIISGRYVDVVERHEGVWRFVERTKIRDLEGDLTEHLLWRPELAAESDGAAQPVGG